MDTLDEMIRKMRESALSKCKDRIDFAAKTCKKKKFESERGTSSILKNKHLLIFLALCIFTPSVFAVGITQNNTIITTSSVIELEGGTAKPPVAYLGEYVDLTKVIGWTGQLGFWYGDPVRGSRPDIIIDASTFQHRYWIDPSKFRVGYWYKWDGTWENAGNMDAFEVRAGIRPVPVPTEPSGYIVPTISVTPLITPAPEERAPIHILIARGDEITYYYNGVPADNKQAHLWLGGQIQSILGDEMVVNNNVASYAFREQVTQTLQPGWYYGYLQFSRGRPDVWYNASHKIGDYYTKVLDTPYDDTIIPDIDVSPYIPEHILADFEKLESNKDYTSDTLVKITMEVVDPTLTFKDYYEEDDNIVIKGNSTVAEGTNISFVIDPDDQIGGYSLNSHTFTTQLVGGIDNERRFEIAVPVQWEEMSVGEEHVVVASLDRLKIHLKQSKEFSIKSVWVNPTPIQITEKVIVDGDGWHRVSITPTPTPTPQIVYVTQPPQLIYVYMTNTTTAQPANPPVSTTTTPEESPIEPAIAVVALIGVAYAVMRKR